MKRSVRIGLVLVAAASAVAAGAYLWYRDSSAMARGEQAAPLPRPGDQEIAWIEAATGGASWERFIDGLRHVEAGPFGRQLGLKLNTARATTVQDTNIPEVGLSIQGCPHTLWIRWYKLTGDIREAKWIKVLAERNPAPLALIGGASSDRATELALRLAEQSAWRGQRPTLLLTTATADEVLVRQDDALKRVPLMSLYAGRTFRFCFTNSQMATALVAFVNNRQELRPGDPALAIRMHWNDDPYSLDLSNRLRDASAEVWPNIAVYPVPIPYTVGDYWTPNRHEERAIQSIVRAPDFQQQAPVLLLLPTVERPARRVLRGFSVKAPELASRMVALTGDSLSFNTVFRDRNLGWRIQELPVPLLLFKHENPVALGSLAFHPARDLVPLLHLAPGTLVPPVPLHVEYGEESASDDLLLNARIVRMVLQAAFHGTGERRTLTAHGEEFCARLRESKTESGSPFFAANGDREGGSGEYVVYLRPLREEGRVLPHAVLEVWSWQAPPETAGPTSAKAPPSQDAAPQARRWSPVHLLRVGYGEGGKPWHE